MKLKTSLYCVCCRNFLKCKRKFEPTTEVIYSSLKLVGTKVILGDAIKCIKPISSDINSDNK